MTEVLKLLGKIAEATKVDAVWDLSVAYFRELGFSRVNYGFTRFRTPNSIGDPDDVLFLSTFPPDYISFYFRDGFYARTAPFRWATQNEGNCTWRWVESAIAAGTLSESEVEAARVNREMGIVAGITYSFPEALARQKGALGLAADPGMTHDDVDAVLAKDGPALHATAHMMHLRISQLPLTTRRRPLTDRQREALRWVAEGKTTQDIATIMGVSAAMVEKHLRLAREALDVETTAQAVAKGTLLNQIFPQTAPHARQS